MKKIIASAIFIALLGSVFYYRQHSNKPDFENYKIPKYKKSKHERYLGPKSNLWEIRAYPHNDIDISAYRKGQQQANNLKQELLTRKDAKKLGVSWANKCWR